MTQPSRSFNPLVAHLAVARSSAKLTIAAIAMLALSRVAHASGARPTRRPTRRTAAGRHLLVAGEQLRKNAAALSLVRRC